MSQYPPSPYQNLPPPPGGTRSRGSSNASTNKYVPDNYLATQAPPLPQGTYFPPHQEAPRPRGPSIADQPIASTPPVPVASYAPPPTSMPGSQRQLQQPYPETSMYPSNSPPYPHEGDPLTTVRRQQQQQPQPQQQQALPVATRRLSANSGHSRPNSHRRSASSHRRSSSRDRDRVRDVDDDDQNDHSRHHHHYHRHHHDDKHSAADADDGRDPNALRRTNTRRPTIGDTIYGLFGVIKDALGPRDKY